MSLPLRKCGLKHEKLNIFGIKGIVTSLAEVWIETYIYWKCSICNGVTSLAEVWIETKLSLRCIRRNRVTSLAEVWIETRLWVLMKKKELVTSLAEVWIETPHPIICLILVHGHFPCGSVD